MMKSMSAQMPAPPHVISFTIPRPVWPDAVFQKLSDEYLAGYLAWRPATGTSLGLHEYDGRITDVSRASLDAELRRLKEFDQKLAHIDPKHLTREAAFDYRLLQSS